MPGQFQLPKAQGQQATRAAQDGRLWATCLLCVGRWQWFAPALHVCSASTAAGMEKAPLAVQKEKRRTPAWTDRVLFRGGARPVKQLTYTSANLLVSDHKPVCSNLRLQVGLWHCSLTLLATDQIVCRASAALHLALWWTPCRSLRGISGSA